MSGPVVTTLLTTNPASGTLVTDGSEDTFTSGAAVSGTFVLKLDTAAMVDGDAMELRGYSKAGATERPVFYYSLSNGQGETCHVTPAIVTAEDVKFTIKRVAGGDRSFPWEILNLNGT